MVALWLSWGLWGFMRVELSGYGVKSEMPPIFLAFLACFALSALAVASIVIACLVVLDCFVPVLCGFLLGCWLSFPLDGMTKRKGKPCWLVLSLFVGCGLVYPIALGITKLLQAVSILRELPTIQATEKKLQLYPIIL